MTVHTEKLIALRNLLGDKFKATLVMHDYKEFSLNIYGVDGGHVSFVLGDKVRLRNPETLETSIVERSDVPDDQKHNIIELQAPYVPLSLLNGSGAV